MDPKEGGGAAGDEDPRLVDGVVGGVEGAVVREGGGGEGEEEGGGYALVDRVFGDVDQEEGEHVREEEAPGPVEVGEEVGSGVVRWWVGVRVGGEEAGVFGVGGFVVGRVE